MCHRHLSTSTTTDTRTCTYCAMMPSNEPVDTSLVGVAVTVIITSIITAIVSTTMIYLNVLCFTLSIEKEYLGLGLALD